MDKKKKEIIIGISIGAVVTTITTWVVEPLRDFVVTNIFLKSFNLFLKISSMIWNFLRNTHEINGFLIVLSILAWVFVFFVLFVTVMDNISSRIATHKNYTQDNFKGLKWKWYWDDDGIHNLWCFCPQCDYELSCFEEKLYDNRYFATPQVVLTCEHCQKSYPIVGYNKNYLLSVIRREIYRKIRTGEKPDKKEVSHA
jgi:hypothetical protein